MRLDGLQKALERIDRKVISLAVALPGKRYAIGFSLIICLLVLGASTLLYATRETLQIDLFFIPIMLACIFFRMKGLFFLPIALLGYHLGVCRADIPPLMIAFSDVIEFLKWSLLAAIIIFAANKFGVIKKFEERMKRDVDLAKALQKTLLSKSFNLKNVRAFGYIHQCMEVGGDFYFLRPFKKKYVVTSIGDVMGKGIPASLVMAVIMGFFYEWGKKSYSPAFIFDKINRRFIDLFGQGAWYSTLFYSIYDEETREYTYANAGHQKALWLKAGGEIAQLEGEGFPVGVFSDYQWEENKIALSPGDRIILYTDGVTEARNTSGEIFSLPRLLSRIEETRSLQLEEMLESILEDVKSHSGPYFESDDVALVMMEVKDGEQGFNDKELSG